MHLDPVPDDGDGGTRDPDVVNLLPQEGIHGPVGLPGIRGSAGGGPGASGAGVAVPPRIPTARKHTRRQRADQEIARMPAPALRLTVPSR